MICSCKNCVQTKEECDRYCSNTHPLLGRNPCPCSCHPWPNSAGKAPCVICQDSNSINNLCEEHWKGYNEQLQKVVAEQGQEPKPSPVKECGCDFICGHSLKTTPPDKNPYEQKILVECTCGKKLCPIHLDDKCPVDPVESKIEEILDPMVDNTTVVSWNIPSLRFKLKELGSLAQKQEQKDKK